MIKISSLIILLSTLVVNVYCQNTFPSTGNVGIGEASPTSPLDIKGLTTMKPLSTGGAFLLANDPAWGNSGLFQTTGTGDLHIKAYSLGFAVNQLFLKSGGAIGIGTTSPVSKLDVRGHLTLEASGNPFIYTGTGPTEFNRYLCLLNSTESSTASGLMAGGILVSESYNYASPGKNDLVVKGNISIGTPTHPSGYKLAVNGNMIAESVKVKLNSAWPDYVFNKNYTLKPLSEVERYIKANNRLSDIPSAVEVEKDGLNLCEMNSKLLQKIEELTLYIIDQNKRIEKLEAGKKEVPACAKIVKGK